MSLASGLLSHRGFVWVTYESPANVSRRSCKQLGIDPDSCKVTTRVCLNLIRNIANWAKEHNVELVGKETTYTPLMEGNDAIVALDGVEYIRGTVVHRKVLSDTTPQGVLMNAPRKPRGNAWDKFRTYRLDRVVVELTE